ncbi:Peroxisome chaperone and import receptor [Coemansia javaensis]|uniref:Peroxisome chaperone and import receptor n=1 Tax=Coemansia javaensis TaxID=2761396 RepID=A0A9W8HQC5_9FUNG|nr:Peroxisome chaperone and import receptor [Coemansia javaensis]
MANAPPSDAELDELLDSALQEFSEPPRPKPKPAATAAPQDSTAAAQSADGFEDEFMRQLARGMEDLLKDGPGAGDPEMRGALDQLVEQLGSLRGDLADAPDKAADSRDAGPRSGSGGGGGDAATFQDKIKATMDKLRESADRAEAEAEAEAGAGAGAGDGDMMAELMRQLDEAGDDPKLDALVDDVIGQLMSRDVLQQPLRDLDAAYPRYLEEHRASLAADDVRRYEQQHAYVRQILALFAEAGDDDDGGGSANDPRIVELMQKMQDCGQPPAELLKLLAPDMELDDGGNIKVPEAPNCVVM